MATRYVHLAIAAPAARSGSSAQGKLGTNQYEALHRIMQSIMCISTCREHVVDECRKTREAMDMLRYRLSVRQGHNGFASYNWSWYDVLVNTGIRGLFSTDMVLGYPVCNIRVYWNQSDKDCTKFSELYAFFHIRGMGHGSRSDKILLDQPRCIHVS